MNYVDSYAAHQIERSIVAIIDNNDKKFRRVEADAITTLSKVVTSYANNILRNAKRYSEHAGNETLTMEDLFAGGEDYGMKASDLYNYTLVNAPFSLPPLPLFPVQNDRSVESFTFPPVVGSTVVDHLHTPNAEATQLIENILLNETPPSSSGSNESISDLPTFLPPFPNSVPKNMIHPPILPIKTIVRRPLDVTFDELHNDKTPVDLTPLNIPNLGGTFQLWTLQESESSIKPNLHQRTTTTKKQKSRVRKAPVQKAVATSRKSVKKGSTSTMSNVTAAAKRPPRHSSPIKMVFHRSAPETLISASSQHGYEVTYSSIKPNLHQRTTTTKKQKSRVQKTPVQKAVAVSRKSLKNGATLIPSTSTMSNAAAVKRPPLKMVLRRTLIKPPRHSSTNKMVLRRSSAPETLTQHKYEVTYCSTTANIEEEDQGQ